MRNQKVSDADVIYSQLKLKYNELNRNESKLKNL